MMKLEKKHKLLVIDDNEQFVSVLKNFLSQKYDVITAYTGLDGLKVFEAHEANIDLVITDLVMPEITGIGVISLIKKKYPGTPVIAITGKGKHPGTVAMDCEADMLLNKPFDLMDLDRYVTKLLAERT